MIEKRNSDRRKRPAHRQPADGSPRRRRRRPANKGQRYPAEVLTADEVRALITACSNCAPTGVRNRALLVLLYHAGCRISEALRLLPKGLDRAAGTVTVLRGKGGTRRTIGLDPGAFAVVERWLDVRAKRGIGGRAPIICTLQGKPGGAAYVRTLLPRRPPPAAPYVLTLMPRLARRAGIEKRVHAHGLRHTHAAELALEGHPMNLIQAQLGHTPWAGHV